MEIRIYISEKLPRELALAMASEAVQEFVQLML